MLNFGFSFFNYVGMQKINVSGGEPFIEGRHGKFVGDYEWSDIVNTNLG